MSKTLPLFVLCLLLGACASERVVLLPSTDGSPGKVIVRDAAGERVLDQPYAATARRLGINRPTVTEAAQVEVRYGETLRALPPRPTSYTVYFETGTDTMTPASAQAFVGVKREIAERPAVEVMVIGHTDRVGSPAENDPLSRQRAELVRDQLVAEGVPAEKLEVAGRGEREPLVPTADDVDEPRNRRVEISIR
ncbi:OmpA family protein [Azonexus caeni]|jgi:outer membrane protein OmpA-like peptidoglycan-associated protein|uniref:OmpA family protein n=1 Tax=Azonexus caeni TaxID=266126 RepID=UPI002CCEFF4A|nr:OmpA family protein [Azonexus sp.]